MRAMVQVNAFLPLVSVAPQVYHQLARDACRHARTVVLLDQVQRHVDPGGDSGAGRNAPIVDEQTIADHLGAWIFLLHLVHSLPVCGAAPTIKQSSFPQHESTGAHRAHLRSCIERSFEPWPESARRPDLPHRISRDDDDVTRLHLGQRLKAGEINALRARNGGGDRAVADDVIRAELPRLIERLHRPANVEHFRLRDINEDYAATRLKRSFTSASISATVVMRAKRFRSAYSVRSLIASTPNSSPGLSQFGIGNVIVASITKSTAYPRSAATRADVSQHCSICMPAMATRRTPFSSSSVESPVLVKTFRVFFWMTGSVERGSISSMSLNIG